MVKLTNLNKNLTQKDKATRDGTPISSGITGPIKSGLGDPAKPNPLVAKFLDENPDYEGFYQMFPDEQAIAAADFLRNRAQSVGNSLPEGDNVFAENFRQKYDQDRIIPDEEKVRPENLSEFFIQPAASANATMDPNVAGKFPSNQVNL